MLTFDQCLGIREACICVKDIVRKSKYRRLSVTELGELYSHLARIEAWLNRHPTCSERVYAGLHKRWARLKKTFKRG